MKTQAQLEIENAELRGQNSALREMLEKLMAKPPAVQHIPCALPHYPPIQAAPVVPFRPIGSPWWEVFPFRDLTACAAPQFGPAQTIEWNGPFPTFYPNAGNALCAGAGPQFGTYHMTLGGSS